MVQRCKKADEDAERARAIQEAKEALEREIEVRVRLEQHLQNSQKLEALGGLAGGIAHDFNNMLSVVIGNLDLLKRRTELEAKLLRLVDNALEGADRAATLTSRLLAFSRQQSLKPQVTDLNLLLRNMEDFLGRTLGETVRVEFDLADEGFVRQ